MKSRSGCRMRWLGISVKIRDTRIMQIFSAKRDISTLRQLKLPKKSDSIGFLHLKEQKTIQ